MEQRFVTRSVRETEELAARLGEQLHGGEVLAFSGGMGMGKTAFTRGLVRGLGGGDVVSSPTFALVNEYACRVTVDHFDMYRVDTWDSLYSTGFFDYLSDPQRVLVIEWSENIESALPEDAVRISIRQGESEEERIISIEGGRGNCEWRVS